MSLADQIIEHGPYGAYQIVPNAVMRYIESDQLNELRDELIAARALKELLADGRFRLDRLWLDQGDLRIIFECDRDGCAWLLELEEPTDLGELVQRATQHTEECR